MFCGWKYKFGLNHQAICDTKERFLEFLMMYAGSTVDCLAFKGAAVYKQLQEGLLALGFCIYGDNVHLDSPYMATPYSSCPVVSSKDPFNFYHSQIQIHSKCAFGKLTQHWGIPQSTPPKNMSIEKV